MKKYLLMNGPNLNLLGVREPSIYGDNSLQAIEQSLKEQAEAAGVELECFQSNHEGALIDRIQEAFAEGVDGIVYNPGAHTHYSYALRDAISSVPIPVVEVHISDVDSREPFRSISVLAPACVAQVKGLGVAGYGKALEGLLEGWNVKLGEHYHDVGRASIVIGTPDGPKALA